MLLAREDGLPSNARPVARRSHHCHRPHRDASYTYKARITRKDVSAWLATARGQACKVEYSRKESDAQAISYQSIHYFTCRIEERVPGGTSNFSTSPN